MQDETIDFRHEVEYMLAMGRRLWTQGTWREDHQPDHGPSIG